MEGYSHSIEKILARPFVIASGSINNATTAITTISLATFFSDPTVTAYLSLFHVMRCDFHIKLMVNATPYTFGRVLISFQPYRGSRGTNRLSSLTNFTQLTASPYSELDIGSAEAVTCSIPYMGNQPLMIVPSITTESESGWGRFEIVMINQLKSADSVSTATYSITAWVDNIHLSIPRAQSGVSAREEERGGRDVNLNVNVNRRHRPIIERNQSEQTGWMGKLLQGASTMLGFSKPGDPRSPMPMVNIPARNCTHVDGVDTSTTLALRQDNEVRADACRLLSPHDPMDITTFLKPYQYLTRTTWTTSQVSNDVIWTHTVDPSDYNGTRFGFIKDNFQFYKGSVNFRFSLVKNAFYSGRLVIEFFPNSGAVTATCTGDAPNVIWDITTNHEMEVSVPYCNVRRFITSQVQVGRLAIRVYNPLKATDTAPTSLDLNVYVSAGDDFEFAGPRPTQLAYAQSGVIRRFPAPIKQAMFSEPESAPLHNHPSENLINLLPTVDAFVHSASQEVMGEVFLTLRDLISRFTACGSIAAQYFGMDPLYFGPVDTQVPMWALSYYYNLCRGSVRYKIITTLPPRTASNEPCPHYTCISYIDYDPTPSILPSPFVDVAPVDQLVAPFHITSPTNNIAHEVRVPFYANQDFFPCTSDNTITSFTSRPILRVYYTYDPLVYTKPPESLILIAAGEDFSFAIPYGARTVS